jgi:hypothetical protein
VDYAENWDEQNPAKSEEGERYLALHDIVLKGMKVHHQQAKGGEEKKETEDEVVKLARKLVEFEEESLGSLWW